MAIEQTLILIKPDGLHRKLTGLTIDRLDGAGLEMVAAKMVSVSQELAEKHYAEHVGKPVPRMPLLAILVKGHERRFRFVALQQAQGQVSAIAPELPADAKLFVHQERIELLCARCASGEQHVGGDFLDDFVGQQMHEGIPRAQPR